MKAVHFTLAINQSNRCTPPFLTHVLGTESRLAQSHPLSLIQAIPEAIFQASTGGLHIFRRKFGEKLLSQFMWQITVVALCYEYQFPRAHTHD
ncbi:8a4c2668-f4dd-46e4-a93e-c6aee5a71114 [Sclerotinia trifoliorum]|uniref:8a4c2668-f4dd-46e4-a93e-c6aee5a71114 n=1 Tax=Sclerotinia trifoliorum TaxID=28548 RepID=A0A8H2VWF8_9HELO|nr:8a4c2668-f4dd-46e4-a93e-c6aee5a71114 [Sclerotinia trifoliorum]